MLLRRGTTTLALAVHRVCGSAALCTHHRCRHQQRAYKTHSDVASPHPSPSPSATAAELFERTFGDSSASSTTTKTPALHATPLHEQVEALFVKEFGADATPLLHFTRHRHSGDAARTQTASAAAVSTPTQLPARDEGGQRRLRAWAGLWELLGRDHYAGVPIPNDTNTGAVRRGVHQNRGGGARDPQSGSAGAAMQGAASPSSVAAATALHRSAADSSSRYAAEHDGRHSPHHHQPHQHPSGTVENPVSPSLQRYWRSYRLWQHVHQHTQQEGGVLEGIRAQIREMKAAQRIQFQAQLKNTTRWTVFVVLPLLTLLWFSIFFDSVLYRMELAQLGYVNYEAALAEFEEANTQQQRGRAETRLKKSEVRID
jgi:hypothetical protein